MSFQLLRHSLPVMSDNGPQYVSQEFSNFAKAYGFQLVTRSLYYAKATGKAESAVKEAKKMLKKSDLLSVSWTKGIRLPRV